MNNKLSTLFLLVLVSFTIADPVELQLNTWKDSITIPNGDDPRTIQLQWTASSSEEKVNLIIVRDQSNF